MNELVAKQQLITYIKGKINLSLADEEVISYSFQLKHLDKKEYLFKEGGDFKSTCFIISGAVRIFHTDSKSLEHILYFGFKDWWVGDMAAVINKEPNGISVQAMEDSYILYIEETQMESLYIKVPAVERLFRIITQKTLSVFQKRLFMAYSASAKDRYLELINRHPGIEQLIPQHQIASYLGVLPESLSRIKRQLYPVKK
jgi:CRP-like cAMP-binding protein